MSLPEGGGLEPGHPLSYPQHGFLFCQIHFIASRILSQLFCTSSESLDLAPINDELYESPLETLQKPEECQPYCVVH